MDEWWIDGWWIDGWRIDGWWIDGWMSGGGMDRWMDDDTPHHSGQRRGEDVDIGLLQGSREDLKVTCGRALQSMRAVGKMKFIQVVAALSR